MATLDTTIVADLRRDGLLREGHFAYRSGRHSALLLDRDRLLADPGAASHMGYALAKHFFTDHIDTIASPSIWGAGLAQWVGYFLDPKAKVVYATPKDGHLTIAENLESLIRDQRVLVVDNLVISGETVRQFDDTICALGGQVIGLGTIWNIGDSNVGGHEIIGLFNTLYEAYAPADCPLCAAGDDPPTPVNY